MKKYTYVDLLLALDVQAAHPGGLELTKRLLATQPIDSKTCVLEAGCGKGETAAYLSESYHCQVVAIDHHPDMVAKAVSTCAPFPNVHVKEATIEELPFPNDSFDLILSESVLAFLQAETGLKEMYRVLKKDGSLILLEMSQKTSMEEPEIEEIKRFYGIHKIHSKSDWKKLLNDVGFSKVDQLNITTEGEEGVDVTITENMNDELLQLLDEHNRLMSKYGDELTYSVFHCEK
ncbi:class I SAM-dependent methyltransferase [Salipaludibacillus daqingensis]|uniref:class I SAM-dependent methyltransferase n=1 Tax=Salipaludibacillus daqingensis TaxID=3041001 RepID=UPI0024755026|nr:class I SAM-dependent methyltransferase [Salipaludibacillus daqingensis]